MVGMWRQRKVYRLNASTTQHHVGCNKPAVGDSPWKQWTRSLTFLSLSFIICKKVCNDGFFYLRVLLSTSNAEM